jgi:hypothetical protein
MRRTLKRDGYKLVQCAHPDYEYRAQSPDAKCYQVIHDDLGFIGTVGTYQQKFERRPHPGARYVTRRWYSQRWWSQLAIEPQRWRTKHFTGPGEAAQQMIWRAKSEAKDRARAKAGKGSV